MFTQNWTTLQVILSLIIILLHGCLFYFLSPKKQNQGGCFEHHWRRLGLSLSCAHILSGVCLLLSGIYNLMFYRGSVIGSIEIDIMLITVFCVMLHLLSLLINDFKYISSHNALPEENAFYVMLTWISTSLGVLLFIFVEAIDEVSKILCVIFIIIDVFLVVAYAEICRRIFMFKEMDKYGTENFTVPFHHDGNKQFLFPGVLLSISFVFCTLLLALERLIWQQNDVVSYISVVLNSISQGLICILHLHMSK